jgi:hypothetical protein
MSSIFKSVVERVMASCGRGMCLRLTGSKFGLSYDDWENLIRKQLREVKFKTPRCQRFRAWDPEVRLAQLKSLEQ